MAFLSSQQTHRRMSYVLQFTKHQEETIKAIPIPEPVLHYNKYMGRVGLCDALHVGLLQCLVKDKEKSGPVRHYISNTSWTLAIVDALNLHQELKKSIQLCYVQ